VLRSVSAMKLGGHIQSVHSMPASVTQDVTTDLGTCTVRVQQLGGCFIARLTGEIDACSASSLQRSLCGLADLGHVVVDLSRVTFLDSLAVQALAEADKRTVARGTSIHLTGACGTVLKVLKITHLDALLDHHRDIADALEAALASRAKSSV
jgi:anti-anti-sigma factor